MERDLPLLRRRPPRRLSHTTLRNYKFSERRELPAETVIASINCSFHDDVPIIIEVFALEINLSTMF